MKKLLFFIFLSLFFSNSDGQFTNKLSNRSKKQKIDEDLSEIRRYRDFTKDSSNSDDVDYSDYNEDKPSRNDESLLESPIDTESLARDLNKDIIAFNKKFADEKYTPIINIENFYSEKKGIKTVLNDFTSFQGEIDEPTERYLFLKNKLIVPISNDNFIKVFFGILENVIDKQIANLRKFLKCDDSRDNCSYLDKSNYQKSFEYDTLFALKSIEDKKNLNIYIIGDLHGNFEDLDRIIINLIKSGVLNKNLQIQDNSRIIFLGDAIDRGENSFEILALFMILKIINSEKFIYIKGNHEDITQTSFLDSARDPRIKDFYPLIINGIQHKIDFFKKELDLKNRYKNVNSKSINKNIKDELESNYSKLIAIRKFQASKSIKMVMNLLKYRLGYFFYLLPSIYYLKHNDNIFQFNHAGGAFLSNKYLNNFLIDNTVTFSKFNDKNILWNDVSLNKELNECVENSKRGANSGLLCPLNKIFEEMKSNQITAKFSGHQHEFPRATSGDQYIKDKMIEKYRNYTFANFKDKSKFDYFSQEISKNENKIFKALHELQKINKDQFERMRFPEVIRRINGPSVDSLVNLYKISLNKHIQKIPGWSMLNNEDLSAYLFILISGKIYYPSHPNRVSNYYPSYLELDIRDNEWNVNGHCLGCNDNESKIIKLK